MQINVFSSAWMCSVVIGVCTHADVLLEQQPDYLDRSSSFWTGGSSAQTGDDFQPSHPTLITSVTFWMVSTWPNLPSNWSFLVHRSTDSNPVYGFAPVFDWFYVQTGPSEVIDMGFWPGDETRRVWEVRFENVNLLLDPADTAQGTFWFSPVGHTSNSHPFSRTYWISSGEGVVNGNEAWRKAWPWLYPGWYPLSNSPTRDPSDMAMQIEGTIIPAPFTLAPLAAVVLISHRRRRMER